MVFNSREYSVSAVIFCSDIILSNGEGHIANHTRPLNKNDYFLQSRLELAHTVEKIIFETFWHPLIVNGNIFACGKCL